MFGYPRLASHRRTIALALIAGAILTGGGFTLEHVRELRLAEQRRAYARAMLGFALGRRPAPQFIAAAVGVPITDDRTMRTLWVRFQVARSIARSADSAQTTFALRGFLPPDGWMSDDYARNARAFADVGRHWAAYLEWDGAWAKDAYDLLATETERRAAEAELSGRQKLDLIDPTQPGLSAIGWDLELRREFAAEAHALHAALLESRGRIVLEDGRWRFTDARTRQAYARHTANLRRIAALLELNGARRAAAYGVEPATGVVPEVVARMRAAAS